jgi:flagellar FliL protein
MASRAEGNEVPGAATTSQEKPGFVQLLMVIVAAVLICALLLGGAIYYLAKSGRLGAVTAVPPSTPGVSKVETVAVPPTHAMVLEPMVVNLSDEGGKAYLRLGVTLRVMDPELKKGEKAKEEQPKEAKDISDADAAVRDTALEVLGRQTAQVLLAPEGKEQLKKELKAAIAQHDPELKVTEVFFTEFLVQR